MAYKIIVSPRAQTDIIKALDFYSMRSEAAARDFVKMLQWAYQTLENSPFYSIRYKNVRQFNLDKFPYALFFTVNETQNIVKILACLHQKSNPKSRP